MPCDCAPMQLTHDELHCCICRSIVRPVVAHNRAWDHNNVYARQNGGTYDFLLGNTSKGEPLGLPLERRFWDDLLQNAREWGCINYQQGALKCGRDGQASCVDGGRLVAGGCYMHVLTVC